MPGTLTCNLFPCPINPGLRETRYLLIVRIQLAGLLLVCRLTALNRWVRGRLKCSVSEHAASIYRSVDMRNSELGKFPAAVCVWAEQLAALRLALASFYIVLVEQVHRRVWHHKLSDFEPGLGHLVDVQLQKIHLRETDPCNSNDLNCSLW